MANDVGKITQLAFNAVEDYDTVMETCSSTEEVLDYLQNGNNFKSLSSQIKETMVKAGACEETAEQEIVIKILFNGYLKQHPDYSESEKISIKKKLREWLSGKTKSIRHRIDAIELCFVLNLDLEQATEFLNKTGFNQLNVRDAEDAIYLYCILRQQPWSTAIKLISEYNEFSSAPMSEINSLKTSHGGNTTVLLQSELENSISSMNIHSSDWENDEAFLNTFLLPNKNHFLGYSFTALKEYYLLKNTLFATVIRHEVASESGYVRQRYENLLLKQYDDIKQEQICFSLAVRSALRKFDDKPSHILHEACKLLNDDMKNAEAAMDSVYALIEKTTEIEGQIVISQFLQDIIKNEGFLKLVVVSIQDNDTGRIRKYQESELKDSVMKEFPRDNTFVKFERTPEDAYQNKATRKAIILMSFILYAYSFSTCISESLIAENEFELEVFMEKLNSILSKCKMSKLYPANQFDWLILRSVKEFEMAIYDGFEIDPLDFFNEVLDFSFNASNIE